MMTQGFMAVIKLSNGDVVIYNPVKISEKVCSRSMCTRIGDPSSERSASADGGINNRQLLPLENYVKCIGALQWGTSR